MKRTSTMMINGSLKQLVFVTGNKNKLEEVQKILTYGNLTNKKVDLPELQGEAEYIVTEKCRLAAQEIKGPVIVEDTSLCFNALNGLPGPYIKWFLEKVGHTGLNQMLSGFEDKSGYGQCMIALAFPGEEPILFVGKCPGQIVQARKTDQKETFGWDPIFQPDTDSANNPNTLTFAEMDKLEKNKISHRSMAVAKLNAYLEANMERFQDTKGEKQ